MHLSLAEVILIVLTAGQLIFAALDYRTRAATMQINQVSQRRHPTLVIALFMILTWAAVAFNYVDRHYLSVPQIPEDYIQEYGMKGVKWVNGFSYIMKVNTKQLLQFSEAYKLAFIIRVQYADRDRMTDTAIEKSGLYTIAEQYNYIGASIV